MKLLARNNWADPAHLIDRNPASNAGRSHPILAVEGAMSGLNRTFSRGDYNTANACGVSGSDGGPQISENSSRYRWVVTAPFDPPRSAAIPGRRAKRVVIVDDSPSMRLWLRYVLDEDGRLQVVGEAADAQEARKVIREVKPDVVTLDVEMPGMSGLEFLDHLMRLNPLPVVMISSATGHGSDAAIKALSAGAIDCLVKPGNALDAAAQRDLVRRVFAAACSVVPDRATPPRHAAHTNVARSAGPTPIILIGASTGGVTALETMLPTLDANGPPVVIVQHMPGTFLVSFAQRLNRLLPQSVGLLREGERLVSGQIVLAPSTGMGNSLIGRSAGQWYGKFAPAEPEALHSPSVNVLFASAVPYAGDVIAVLLTGLGRDGAEAMRDLQQAGARTLAQDKETSVVYGMPRAAAEIGAAQRILPLTDIGPLVNRLAAVQLRRGERG